MKALFDVLDPFIRTKRNEVWAVGLSREPQVLRGLHSIPTCETISDALVNILFHRKLEMMTTVASTGLPFLSLHSAATA